jgi:hypothetical protein
MAAKGSHCRRAEYEAGAQRGAGPAAVCVCINRQGKMLGVIRTHANIIVKGGGAFGSLSPEEFIITWLRNQAGHQLSTSAST